MTWIYFHTALQVDVAPGADGKTCEALVKFVLEAHLETPPFEMLVTPIAFKIKTADVFTKLQDDPGEYFSKAVVQDSDWDKVTLNPQPP